MRWACRPSRPYIGQKIPVERIEPELLIRPPDGPARRRTARAMTTTARTMRATPPAHRPTFGPPGRHPRGAGKPQGGDRGRAVTPSRAPGSEAASLRNRRRPALNLARLSNPLPVPHRMRPRRATPSPRRSRSHASRRRRNRSPRRQRQRSVEKPCRAFARTQAAPRTSRTQRSARNRRTSPESSNRHLRAKKPGLFRRIARFFAPR